MCTGSKSNRCPSDSEMEAVSQEDKRVFSHRNCLNLLDLAATDDLAGFIHDIEEKNSDINEASFWYGRSFGSKKMGFEKMTPIMIASLYGSTQILKYIVQTGKVDINKSCGSDRATPLHCAAAGGSWSSVEAVRLLIDASGDINAVDANGMKPSDAIAPCVKSLSSSKRKTLEMVLNGIYVENGDHEEEGEDERIETRHVAKEGIGGEKKEYPVDVSLPDINIGVYGTDEFRMYNFKVKPCSRAYSHDWTECPFAHPGENARRRDPRKYNYTCVPCPDFKKGSCGKGDACEYAHGVFESWLHPAQYRTRLCKDETGCSRKVCFFAHKPEELRPLYASTGSAMPSPKPGLGNSLDLTAMGPLSLPSSMMVPNTSSISPLDMELLSSPYGRMGDLKPTNLDNIFGSLDPLLLSHHLQGVSPKVNNANHLRASYPSNILSRKPSAYGFDSSAAVATAVMNSRSTSFAKRSQSFVDRPGGIYQPRVHSDSPPNSVCPMPMMKLSDWGSPDGKLDWGFNGEEVNKLRKSASFGIRSGMGPSNADGAGSGGVHDVMMMMMPHWVDQMYMEQEQMVA